MVRTKVCKDCTIEKDMGLFYKTKNGNYNDCIECRKKKQIQYNQKNDRKTYQRLYYAANTQKKIEQQTQYRKNNRESYNSYQVQYQRNRRKTDINYKISVLLRGRLNQAINSGYKAGSSVNDLGCSIEFFKSYIEQFFRVGMSWENWGKWHLDHIIPLASFDLTNKEQFLKACHYTNYQPLWAGDNLRKGDTIK